MPQSLEGLKAIFLYPVIGIFLIGAVMFFLVEPMTAINEGMKDFLADFQGANPVILGLIIGCMSAFDMGGPVNKAAYVTGTALLAEGNQYFMAGVSAACITPPLVIAFATLLFRKYFSQQDRNAGLVNFILGATHITEGAIPFAAKTDPCHPDFDDRLFDIGDINILIRSSSTCPARRIPCTSRCHRSLSMGVVDYHRIAYRRLLIRFLSKTDI